MTQDELKLAAARAALTYVTEDSVVGVGTGSTANYFIAELGKLKFPIRGAIASSEASAQKLRQAGVEVLDLNTVDDMPVYVDGADEVTRGLLMIKGGGGALTREKIVAAVARTFICVADASKLVERLGKFALPIEVIPMARAYVARELARMGGRPAWRSGFTTDNGNVILDVHGLAMPDPAALETAINQIAGVVANGLFARRGADVLLLAGANGVRALKPTP